jgi:sensor histidine kinase YesM
MASWAPPIMHFFGATRVGSNSGPATRELLPLLKVRMIHALLVTVLIVAQYWFELASSLSDQPHLLVETFFNLFERNVMYWIVGFAIIAVVQTRIAPGRTRTIVLLSSMLVWSALWSLWTVWAPLSPFIVIELGLSTPTGVAMDGRWTTTTYLLLAAWYYESADRARRSTAALRQSELVRRGAEQWLLELRLGSLQARLDPQVLFDTLDEAGRLYRSRPAAAEQLLDALIDYLRRALPQLRQAQSTLEREVALALAYTRVLRAADGKSLEVESDVEPAVGDARFPPMVVQPLCDALARSTLAGGEPARMRISATRDQDGARLCVTAQPARAAPASKRLEDIRHTLLAMFGPLVRMDATGPMAGVVSVSVEVPYDAAPGADR